MGREDCSYHCLIANLTRSPSPGWARLVLYPTHLVLYPTHLSAGEPLVGGAGGKERLAHKTRK